MSSWSDRARPIIAEVIRKFGREDSPELRKALREAYPFGARKYWPYKAWLSEIRRQRFGSTAKARRAESENNGQGSLL